MGNNARTWGIVALGLALLAPTALAGHGGPSKTLHRTYEFAHHNQGPFWAAGDCITGEETGGALACDPTGQMQDGSFDVGGVWEHQHDPEVPHGTDGVQVRVVDDIWGGGVLAASLCTDDDDDQLCGETGEGEVRVTFCGDSPSISLSGMWHIAVAVVGGGVRQALWCDINDAPAATSGGVLDPDAGIFLTFE